MKTIPISAVRTQFAGSRFLVTILILLAALVVAMLPQVLHAQDLPLAPDVVNAEDAASRIVINEILTNPDTNTEWIEFIELYNPTEYAVSLEDWRISGGIDYLFPAGVIIASKGFVIIGEAPSHLKTKYGITALGPYDGGLSSSGEEIILTDHRAQVIDEIEYAYGFPWPMPDGDPDRTYQLIHPSLDNALGGNWRSDVATPGALNSTVIFNPPPTFLSVNHSPQQPKGNEAVTVEAKLEDHDGMGAVQLLYQVVAPGQYVTNQDGAYHSFWTPIPMTDQGSGRFTATIPASVNQHRTLIRYRVEAADKGGRKQLAPFADDPQPNFAYFVYNAIPQWSGSITGSAQGVESFNFNNMRPLPVFHFIGKQVDIANALFMPPSEYPSGYMGSDELWRGTLVYEGVVYDHVEFRARGGDFRYATGKSNWRINLHKGHRIQMYDNWGNPYPELADKINLYGISQQVHRDRRGEHGMFDSMTYNLYNMADVAASNTHWVQLRVIDRAAEYGPTQYEGDFWGLYLSVEHPDGSFLDNHDLPDGNLYKVENYEGDLDNLSKNGPDDGSDYDAFHQVISHTVPSADWLKQNIDLENYYSFRSILEFTHDYDVDQGKNYYYFHNDDTNKWMILPWDKDLTWYVNMPGTGVEPFVNHVLSKNEFIVAYQNRLRELRDLLLNQEQLFIMLDEYANVIDTPLGGQTMAKADRFKWDYNPIYGTRYVDPERTAPGFYYESLQWARPPLPPTFRGMVEQMKRYVTERTQWIDTFLLTDQNFPATPVLTYAGAAGYPADAIRFNASAFADPQGANTFAATEWRIAETSLPWDPAPADWTERRKYEINATWESGILAQNGGALVPPQGVIEPGHLYRARVRYMDNSGRWSHWSEPVQFSAAAPASAKASVVVSEIMYHPTPHTNWPADELEFLELYNPGSQTVDLSGWRIEDGIEYTFPQGTLLPADSYLVLAENMDGYQSRYGLVAAGQYDGALSNGGERITLVDAWGRAIFSVEYSDDSPWPEQADGDGYSLVYILGSTDPDNAASWRRSTGVNGSPGEGEPSEVVINEIMIAPAGARAVELYNPGNKAADVSHWYLSEDRSDPRKARLPVGSVVPAGGYLVVPAATLASSSFDGAIDFTPTPNMFMVLTSGRADGNITGYQTAVRYGAPDANLSAGTYVDSEGVTHFPLLSTPTLGAVNAAPKVGPLVISEILFKPLAGASQHIEITNISNAAVTLGDGDPGATWQVQGGFFSFPDALALPAGGKVLVTSDSPHLSCAAMGNRGYTRILGPFAQALSADKQRVALNMPLEIGGMALTDWVEYKTASPWLNPEAGVALIRSNLSAYGNDPSNWQLASGVSPQPAASTLCAFTALPPTIVMTADGTAAAAGASISWTLFDIPEAANFVSFRVLRSAKSTGEPWTEVASINASPQGATATYTVADPTAKNGETWYYALEGVDAQVVTTALGTTTTSIPWQKVNLPRVDN